MTLHRMMVVASCCLFALTVTARADAGAPAKRAVTTHGAEKSKVKKRVKSRISAPKAAAHRAKAATVAIKPPPEKSKDARQTGIASWYGGGRHGKRSANGEVFDKFELTAAHRTLPLESKVRVTNTANGRSVTVRVTDRGPSSKSRIIDLSQTAAEQLGMKQSGVAQVNLEALPAPAKPKP